MAKLYLVFLGLFLLIGFGDTRPSAALGSGPDRLQFPKSYIPPGEQMYKDYCAVCHGADAKGRGPMAAYLTKQPSDLTVLAKNRGGTFPEEYVANILRFGLGSPAHGTSDMPIWGPIFQNLDNYNEAAVRQRIKNLCAFLESIQSK